MFNITSNANDVAKHLDATSKEIRDAVGKETYKAALKVSSNIKKITLSGRDFNGKPFRRYSKSTLEYKKSRGGKFFSGNVDLTDTGKMMAAMQARKISKLEARVFFVSKKERDKAYSHNNGSGKLPKRKFFGLSDKDKNNINYMFKKSVDRILSR